MRMFLNAPSSGRLDRLTGRRLPMQRIALGRPNVLAEESQLDTGDVFDQSEQVRAARYQRAADFVLQETVELPQQCLASSLQVVAKVRLGMRFETSSQHVTPNREVPPGKWRRINRRASRRVVVVVILRLDLNLFGRRCGTANPRSPLRLRRASARDCELSRPDAT